MAPTLKHEVNIGPIYEIQTRKGFLFYFSISYTKQEIHGLNSILCQVLSSFKARPVLKR